MSRRAILMAVCAGLLMFLWQAVAHIAMPWAHATVAGFEDEARVRDVLLEEAPRPGVYFIPFDEEPSPGQPAMFAAVQHNELLNTRTDSSLAGAFLASRLGAEGQGDVPAAARGRSR